MATLLEVVTSLLERSYSEAGGYRAGRGGSGERATFLSDIFQHHGQRRPEGWLLGYQQVIHKAKVPVCAKLSGRYSTSIGHKNSLGLYKCL